MQRATSGRYSPRWPNVAISFHFLRMGPHLLARRAGGAQLAYRSTALRFLPCLRVGPTPAYATQMPECRPTRPTARPFTMTSQHPPSTRPYEPSPIPPGLDPAAPAATVHVDLDGAQDIYEGHGWEYSHTDDPIFETGLRNFLEFFAANGVRATLFVIARSLDDPRKRALIEDAVREGHEIASHSLTHAYLPQLSSAGKRREIAESRQRLEGDLGVRVRGFRAPGYRIDRESLEILADCGYDYDSSAWPTPKWARALASTVATLSAPHRPIDGSPFVEWTMPDYRPFPVPFNPSYSLLIGTWYFRQGLRRYRRSARPLAMLFHLIDLSEPLPADRLRGVSSRVFTLSTASAARKLQRCQQMLDLVRSQYRIMTTADAIDEWRRGTLEPATCGASPKVVGEVTESVRGR